jgi:hypothetical protein
MPESAPDVPGGYSAGNQTEEEQIPLHHRDRKQSRALLPAGLSGFLQKENRLGTATLKASFRQV